MTPEEFTAAINKHYVVRSVQDAAHETYHALTCGIRLPLERWNRENLHEALEERFGYKLAMWWNEVEARGVEWLVCQKLDARYPFGSLECGLYRSQEEAEHYGAPYIGHGRTVEYAKHFITTKRARTSADLVLAYAAKIRASDG